jgi:large subunit ribosomal protein L29
MTRPSEFREMDDSELSTRLAEAKQELFNLRFQHVTGQQDNYARLGQVRKDVARINTLLREREIAAAEAAEAAEGVTRG